MKVDEVIVDCSAAVVDWERCSVVLTHPSLHDVDDGIGQAGVMLGKMFTDFHGSTLALFCISSVVFFGLPVALLEFWLFLRNDDLLPARRHWGLRGVVYSYLTIMLLTFAPSQTHEFIYFQF